MSSIKNGQLRDLIIRVLDGSADLAEHRQLEQELASNPAAIDYYLGFIDVLTCLSHHGSLLQASSAQPFECVEFKRAVEEDLQDSAIRAALREVDSYDEVAPVPDIRRVMLRRNPPTRSQVIRFAARVAAVMAVAVSVIWLDHKLWQVNSAEVSRPIAPAVAPVMAQLERAHNVHWADPYLPSATGSALHSGSYVLDKGTIQLAMNRGVQVIIEGPAQFTLDYDNRIRLHEGLLTATVPPEAVGFTVLAPGADLVDLGTQFGVCVDSGRTEVQVFDGELEATFESSLAGQRTQPRLLRQDDKLTYHQKTGRIFEGVVESAFPRGWEDVLYRLDTSGTFEMIEPPVSLVRNAHQLGHVIGLLEEKRGVRLTEPLRISLIRSGTHPLEFARNRPLEAFLPSGRLLDSYLLHIDRMEKLRSGNGRFSGSVTFIREIAGVICTTDQLVASDPIFAAAGVQYGDHPTRGIYEVGKIDIVEISPDRRTLRFVLNAKNYDQLRILLNSPSAND